MRYDPDQRLAKYDSLSQRVQSLGYAVTVHTRPSVVDAMTILGKADDRNAIVVYRRRRGWFITSQPGPLGRVYEVTIADDLLGMIERCLRSSRAMAEATRLYGLREIPQSQWAADERQEEFERWQEYGWWQMSEEQVNAMAQRYEDVLWHNDELVVPEPSMTWRVNDIYALSDDVLEQLEADLTRKTLRAFKLVVKPGTRLFSLDWQHSCFTFDPHKLVDKPYRDYWANPILSQGDDYIYVSCSFDLGLLSLRDRTFHVFGERLLNELLDDLPDILKAAS